MGNRRGSFVTETTDQETQAAEFVCLVDVGFARGSTHVREGDVFTADPREVAELEAKGYVARVSVDAVPVPVSEPDPESVMTMEPSE